ncbi:peptidyl-prolyl cis-trans isomerase FKBP43-like [Bidens hawaiensis]|uniref:peptidyl-prolyl cis-trans isomerase FKBP43-like n=1 Tax=Bidens hawaiensis TaxID=980011 RepID=UPI004049C577
MAFWGIEVKPGKPYTHSNAGRLRISQATLAIGTATLKSLVQCNVGDKRPVLLCALLPNKTESLQLDLEFDESEDVMFSVIGPRGVYLTGYYVGHNRHSHMQDDSESFGEDIANSESHESNRGSDEDEYEDSFINDDEPEPLTPSPVSSDRDDDEDEGDFLKNRNGNGRRKRLKKRYQAVESDDEMSVPVSDNEDDCLISSICKNKKSESLGEKNSNETLAEVEKKTIEVEKTTQNNDDKCKPDAGDSKILDSKDKVDVFAGTKTEGEGDKLNSSAPSKDEVIPERKSKRNKKKLESSKEEKATDALADKDDQKPDDMGEVLTSTEKKSKTKKRKGRTEENVDVTGNNLLAGNKQDDDQHAVNKSSGADSDQLANGSQSDEKKAKKKRRKTSKTQEVDAEKEDNKQAPTEHESLNKKTSNGLVIEDLVTGEPKGKVAAAGKKVKVQYVVKLKDNGQVVSSNGDTPHKFRLGDKEVIEGLNVGLEGMRVGDKRRLTIPPSMSLGYKGDGENIPPSSWLVYDVEMTSIR